MSNIGQISKESSPAPWARAALAEALEEQRASLAGPFKMFHCQYFDRQDRKSGA